MVVTLPRPLTLLAFDHPRVLYPLVLRAGAEAILQLARRELGVELGVLILLHTWGQLMNRHVHGHCLVSGAAIPGRPENPKKWGLGEGGLREVSC